MNCQPGDNQDKAAWCSYGEGQEDLFLREIAPSVPALKRLRVHPGKPADKYETDFVFADDPSKHADLKRITTPFFKASLYGYSPNHTVTINHKDYLRYSWKYPHYKSEKLSLILWVTWPADVQFGTKVRAVDGVWVLPLRTLDEWIRKGRVANHEYISRREGSGTNATTSWLIDLRLCHKIPTP